MIARIFERLTVLAEAGADHNGSLLYECRCTCGSLWTVRGASLRSGQTKSCGCLRVESSRERAIARNRRRAA